MEAATAKATTAINAIDAAKSTADAAIDAAKATVDAKSTAINAAKDTVDARAAIDAAIADAKAAIAAAIDALNIIDTAIDTNAAIDTAIDTATKAAIDAATKAAIDAINDDDYFDNNDLNDAINDVIDDDINAINAIAAVKAAARDAATKAAIAADIAAAIRSTVKLAAADAAVNTMPAKAAVNTFPPIRLENSKPIPELQEPILVRFDETKESITIEELETLGTSFTTHLCETTFAPQSAQHICHLEKTQDGYVELKWSPSFSFEKRVGFNYTNGLRSVAQYTSDQSVVSSLGVVFAALEQVRLGMRSTTVFFIGFPNTDVYMIENEPNLLLGVNGEIGCGKSTVVDYLSSKHGFTEYMFAQPLKEVAVCLGFEPKQVFGTQEEKLEVNEFWEITGRQFLQVFGSEVCRDYVPKVLPQMKLNGLTMWVRLFEKFKQEHANVNLAVSDVRFEDESNTIKKYGGIVIRIVRSGQASTPAQSQPHAVQTHKSETQASRIYPNVIIHNDRDLETLYKKLDLLVEFIRRGIITSTTFSLNI